MDVRESPERTRPGSEFRAQAIHPASPLTPGNLLSLFLRPTHFFSSEIALGKTPFVVGVSWVVGIAYALGRIDQELLRAEFGRPRPYWASFGHLLTDSWLSFWAIVLAYGALSGLAIWYLGGWWYKVRVRWSGDPAPDQGTARIVYIYASFVAAAPTVFALLGQTLFHSNYGEAYGAEALWPTLLLLFPFWSCIVSYRGVTAVFDVVRRRALVWFVILPFLVYLLAFGLLGVALAWLERQ